MPASDLPFRLLVITDRSAVPAGRTLPEQIELALSSGGDGVAVLLRDKDLAGPARAELARALATITQHAGAQFLVHGDPLLARAVGADGLHVADSARQREILAGESDGWVLGASCHDRSGVQAAVRAGASYVTMSPIYPTPGKASPGQELGLSALSGNPLPVFALGGVTPARGAQIRQAGAWGAATIRAVLAAQSPAAAVRSFLESLCPAS